MVGHLAVDDYREGPRPSVLLCHEGPGLDEHVEGPGRPPGRTRLPGLRARLPGRRRREAARPRDSQARRAHRRSGKEPADRSRAGLDVMLEQGQSDSSRVAAMGYCFGGTMAVELAGALGVDLKALVGFHPGMPAPAVEDTRSITGKLLLLLRLAGPVRHDRIPARVRAGARRRRRRGLADRGLRRGGAQLHQPQNW